jgi:two-component system response regulator FixJ
MSPAKTSYLSKGHVYIINGIDNDHSDDDDHALLVSKSRKSLRNALQELGFNVMTFQGPELFLREHKLSLPAVLLFDTRLHDWSGVSLQSELNQLRLKNAIPIIFLGPNSDAKEIVTAMKQGAVEFFAHPFTLQDICAVIENSMVLNVESSARHSDDEDLKVRLKSLTTREREICFLMIQGYGNIEIAALNGSAAGTVKIHRRRVLLKMGVLTLAHLVTQMNAFDPLRWQVEN